MSVLRRLAGREERWTLANPPELSWSSFGADRSTSGVSVTQASAMGLDAVWACVALLSRSIGMMPLIVYQGDGGARERARDSWQWSLLHERPNGAFAPDAFVGDVVAMLNTWGNWYGEKVKTSRSGRSVVAELWRVDPRKVTVEVLKDGTKRFQIQGESKSFGVDQILHIPGFGYDGQYGMSPISAHRDSLGSELARDEWSGRWYENAATPSGVLKVNGKLDEAGAARLKAAWDAAHRGGNRGGTAVLEDGVSWEQLSIPQKDQQFIEQARFGVSRIARIFQVPPEKIGGERSTNTYANIAAAGLDFVVFSLQHWMVRIEQAFKHDEDLFPTGLGLYPEFLAEGLLRGDPETRGRFYESLSRVKAITPNEIRERENQAPLEGGDVVPTDAPAPAPTDMPPARNGHLDAADLERLLAVNG